MSLKMEIYSSSDLMFNMRIGLGVDIHRTVKGKKLVLAGVHIPSDFGLEAHSDGDVIIHSLCDAILGALAKGNIGEFYPNDDDKYLNYDSRLFLEDMRNLLIFEEYEIENIDICVICEKPRLKDYLGEMIKSLASLLKISIDRICIKPGTNEGLGEIGRCEAIEARSIVLLKKVEEK